MAMQDQSEQERLEELNQLAKTSAGRRQLEDLLKRHLGLKDDATLPPEYSVKAGGSETSSDSSLVWGIMKHEYGR